MYVQNFCRNVLYTIVFLLIVQIRSAFPEYYSEVDEWLKSDTYEVHRIHQIHDLTWSLNSMWVVEFVNLLILDCINNQ